MSRAGILLALATLCLFALFNGADADTCLASPPALKLGANCSPSLYCADGYCNKAGICTAYPVLNEACDPEIGCEYPLDCRGPTGQAKCFARASPGEACSDNSTLLIPRCGDGLSCVDDVCIGGRVGDGCGTTAHCLGNLTCVDSVCTPVKDGLDCDDHSECKPTSYCRAGKCLLKPIEGELCVYGGCADGSVCIGHGPSDSPTCQKRFSRAEGEYCNTGEICKSKTCHTNGKCAGKKTSICSGGWFSMGCAYNEYCTCGGDGLQEGFGTCKPYACQSQYKKIDECVNTNCKNGATDYAKSCANLNCAKLFKGKCGYYDS